MADEKTVKNERPHCPTIKERETLDGGFSKGWGLHFQPSEDYWFDSHTHLRPVDRHSALYRLLDEWFARLDAFRLGRLMAIAEDREKFNTYRDVSDTDQRFNWLVTIPATDPDVDILKAAMDNGARGLKLHNGHIMVGEVEPEVWLSEEWAEIFSMAQAQKMPVLWHVTQRMSASPYHGGGAESYWSKGYKKGVEASNEKLLQMTLEILKRYSELKVIGAHQLHLGTERLSGLLKEYQNLYVDTSCSFFVRWADTIYEEDRKLLRDFVERYPERVLFGTDAQLKVGGIDQYLVQGFLGHARCINQLRLTNETLQKVAYQNAECLYGLDPVEPANRGNVRP